MILLSEWRNQNRRSSSVCYSARRSAGFSLHQHYNRMVKLNPMEELESDDLPAWEEREPEGMEEFRMTDGEGGGREPAGREGIEVTMAWWTAPISTPCSQ